MATDTTEDGYVMNEEWDNAVKHAAEEAAARALTRAAKPRETRLHLTRENDHDTSRAAAAGIEAEISELQTAVLAVHRRFSAGMTDSELRTVCNAELGERPESTYRRRRSDLTKLGLIRETDDRRMNEAGNIEKVWRALQPWELKKDGP